MVEMVLAGSALAGCATIWFKILVPLARSIESHEELREMQNDLAQSPSPDATASLRKLDEAIRSHDGGHQPDPASHPTHSGSRS